MRQITFSKNFKKSMKDVRSYKNYKKEELEKALQTLANGDKLPDSMRDHAMVKHSDGLLQGSRVFHLRPNLVIVYRLYDSELQVLNIGLHNKTNLTSSYNYRK